MAFVTTLVTWDRDHFLDRFAGRDNLLSPSGLTWLARLPERRGIATQYDTHYDAQACWDSHLAPSALHGVTTVVMGNCGVGFAPCRPADRDKLVELMEGVEDIPGAVMHEGLEWQWESFPGYLDALVQKARDVDVCALLPHAAVRVYVMGARALGLEPAAADGRRRRSPTTCCWRTRAGTFCTPRSGTTQRPG